MRTIPLRLYGPSLLRRTRGRPARFPEAFPTLCHWKATASTWPGQCQRGDFRRRTLQGVGLSAVSIRAAQARPRATSCTENKKPRDAGLFWRRTAALLLRRERSWRRRGRRFQHFLFGYIKAKIDRFVCYEAGKPNHPASECKRDGQNRPCNQHLSLDLVDSRLKSILPIANIANFFCQVLDGHIKGGDRTRQLDDRLHCPALVRRLRIRRRQNRRCGLCRGWLFGSARSQDQDSHRELTQSQMFAASRP